MKKKKQKQKRNREQQVRNAEKQVVSLINCKKIQSEEEPQFNSSGIICDMPINVNYVSNQSPKVNIIFEETILHLKMQLR